MSLAARKQKPKRALFSVVQGTGNDGETFLYVDWAPELYPALDQLSPDGQITDRLIDTANELLHAFDDDEEDASDAEGAAVAASAHR